ncbi:hypothetical protein JTB14_014941 [Gonioctena quinquepunctata]|nr:hypothetical protein JTB14_014941 [Gonioctena quinquepunctata]
MLPENLYKSQNFQIKRSHGFQRVCRAPPRERDCITTSSRCICLVPVRVLTATMVVKLLRAMIEPHNRDPERSLLLVTSRFGFSMEHRLFPRNVSEIVIFAVGQFLITFQHGLFS